MDNFRSTYKEETEELLADLESALLELSEDKENMELVSRIFRAMHTIKGSGAMFGFDEIVAFTHDVETVLDLVRDKIIPVNKNLVDLTLAACDQIRQMIEKKPEDNETDNVSEITRSFKKLIPDKNVSDEKTETADNDDLESISEPKTYRIRFRPGPDIFQYGTRPILLLEEIRQMGDCRIIGHTHAIPDLKKLNPESCYIHWNIILTTSKDIDTITDVFVFVEDMSQLNIEIIEESDLLNDDGEYKKVGDILIDRGDITPDDLRDALNSQKRIGEMLVEYQRLDPDIIESALAEQNHMRNLVKKRKDIVSASSIRVASEKLDLLVDLVGEMVTVQASLTQKALNMDDPELLTIAEDVERLTAELRDNTISIRMLPVGTTFAKFKRLVYDLSQELGKEVVLTTRGGETELDKTVIERLNDPMVHIIRNSIGHGIELPDVRKSLGKPAKGNIHLCAEHSGANVLIKISDDGAGLDLDAIRKQAVKNKIIKPDTNISENELYSLIFLPGFSTASSIDEVSGRGVGMDVVKQGIENLRGSIDISSRQGTGTTITLKLPLTLAIIDGLMVELDKTCYVIPLAAVEECLELTSNIVVNGHGRNIASVRGEIVPYIYLRELFKLESTPPETEQIVIVRLNNNRVGFVVENIIGEHQTVIKTLGKIYKNAKVFSGSTILADGTVAVILDPYKLVEIAESEELLERNQYVSWLSY
ncbi:Chemotaxis protein [Desulfonema limicola]|uniref:Chemotaxis protein CheA n=1 Tax=Desulfonema limicola TaxID=45656 RepID=A0A975GHK5_9BACT|nr:chemotaxis protein CheA [Desulfonema limicola]QTA81600.1 Chemotaxis protein [Desulfonema limicola]